MEDKVRIIPPHGGYQKLKSYQMSEIAYDATTIFCDRFIDRLRALTIRWFKQRVAANKTLQKGAWYRARPRSLS